MNGIPASLVFLQSFRLLDAGVLAFALDNYWIETREVADYAVDRLCAGDDGSEVVVLATAEELAADSAAALLWAWAKREALLSADPAVAHRRWMFATLVGVEAGSGTPEEKMDALEEAYADLDYPEELRVCTRYFLPRDAGGDPPRVGDDVPSSLEAMTALVDRLGAGLGVRRPYLATAAATQIAPPSRCP